MTIKAATGITSAAVAGVLLLTIAACAGALPDSVEPAPLAQGLLDSDYRIVHRVADLPAPLIEALSSRLRTIPLMADPGGRFNETDVIDSSLPMRRLVFAGLSEKQAFVHYEHGGRAFHTHLAVFELQGGQESVVFAGRFHLAAENLDQLRSFVAQGEIQDETEIADAHGYW